ncbi:MAG: 1-acyl-sn-glycerol-3-phosphate acyltransferase [Hyphomonadaceae bacterium]|nr:MAG: 1-acyl-sn-glycerol-3-phosphate acyltransferase [Hyphomonadaceae bacterium]
MTKTINLLRSIIYEIWFYLTILFVGGIGMIFTLINPKFALNVVNIWSRVSLFGLRHIMGIEIEIRGRENLINGPMLVAGKHLSTLDTLVPFTVMNTPAFVFKNELFKMPIFGWYLKSAGMIGIDRSGAMAALKSMVTMAKIRNAEGRPILIYPEGTRKELGAETDYKPGVAAIYGLLGVPCVPMALNTGIHWPAHGLRKTPGKVVFEFLPAIEIGLKRQDFMERLENAIETKTAELIKEGQNG